MKPWLSLRPRDFKPVLPAVVEPRTGLSMGQSCELMVKTWAISREEQDRLALDSHRKAAAAWRGGFYDDLVVPFRDLTNDNNVRIDTSLERLAKLKPVFEPPWGQVTAGNSSQITDGASWVILASEDAVAKHGLTPKAVIIDSQWAALDPSIMGLGPVLSATALLKRNDLMLQDIETWELNEAFATQVLGCLAAWNDAEFCREALGLDGAAGRIARDRLNIDGGAIGVGHPVGASGNRIVLHLVNAMKRLGYKRGIATECIGGGQGGAMLIEAV